MFKETVYNLRRDFKSHIRFWENAINKVKFQLSKIYNYSLSSQMSITCTVFRVPGIVAGGPGKCGFEGIKEKIEDPA